MTQSRKSPTHRRDNHNASNYKFMYEFRCKPCSEISGKCTLTKETCFYSHNAQTHRRVPVIMDNGLYNYIPEECNSWKQHQKCTRGDDCRRAHGWLEVIFHPLLYKTKLCDHRKGPDGLCTGFAIHCAKAHNTGEIRNLKKIFGLEWKRHYDLTRKTFEDPADKLKKDKRSDAPAKPSDRFRRPAESKEEGAANGKGEGGNEFKSNNDWLRFGAMRKRKLKEAAANTAGPLVAEGSSWRARVLAAKQAEAEAAARAAGNQQPATVARPKSLRPKRLLAKDSSAVLEFGESPDKEEAAAPALFCKDVMPPRGGSKSVPGGGINKLAKKAAVAAAVAAAKAKLQKQLNKTTQRRVVVLPPLEKDPGSETDPAEFSPKFAPRVLSDDDDDEVPAASNAAANKKKMDDGGPKTCAELRRAVEMVGGCIYGKAMRKKRQQPQSLAATYRNMQSPPKKRRTGLFTKIALDQSGNDFQISVATPVRVKDKKGVVSPELSPAFRVAQGFDPLEAPTSPFGNTEVAAQQYNEAYDIDSAEFRYKLHHHLEKAAQDGNSEAGFLLKAVMKMNSTGMFQAGKGNTTKPKELPIIPAQMTPATEVPHTEQFKTPDNYYDYNLPAAAYNLITPPSDAAQDGDIAPHELFGHSAPAEGGTGDNSPAMLISPKTGETAQKQKGRPAGGPVDDEFRAPSRLPAFRKNTGRSMYAAGNY